MTGVDIYCSGYWQLDKNLKRDLSHYQRLLPKTIKMIRGKRLHLFCGDQSFPSRVEALARRYSVDLTSEIIDLDELPTRGLIAPILKSCDERRNLLLESAVSTTALPATLRREKGEIHFWRDYVRSGSEVYRDLLSIWTSKVPLVSRWISSSEECRNSSVAWIDLSVSRFNGSRTKWNFPKLLMPCDRICHYSSPMLYKGLGLPLNASFIGGCAWLWHDLENLYLQALAARAGDEYAHDEETILSHVVKSNPELFCEIGRPIRGFPRVISKVLSGLGI